MLAAIQCSSDSPPVPLCSDASNSERFHRTVSIGESSLTLDISAISSEVRVTVDGSLAFDVVSSPSAGGTSTIFSQGPAYGAEQHVIHLVQSGDSITGDVDGRSLAPFTKDTDTTNVHFSDGTPFRSGVAPGSNRVAVIYNQLSEALASETCATGPIFLSLPAQHETPEYGDLCHGCHNTCINTFIAQVSTGSSACIAALDGAFGGLLAAICIAAVTGVAAVIEVACSNACDSVGGACCPHSCDLNHDNTFCCDSDSFCSDFENHLCCFNGTQACGSNCCESKETCTDKVDSVCCPNANVCGTSCCGTDQSCASNATTGVKQCCPSGTTTACSGHCCASGQTVCAGGVTCCSPDKVCGTGGNQACCQGASQCVTGPNGPACACDAPNIPCKGGSCCMALFEQCAEKDGCCPSDKPICGGHCCSGLIFPPCTTDSNGNEVCNTCPSGNTVCSGVCCTNGSPCAPNSAGAGQCCPDANACGPTKCCPNGCADPTTGTCNP